jgi:hypothetical protein
MQTSVILAIVAAALVSADAPYTKGYEDVCSKSEYASAPSCVKTPSPTYENKPLPKYAHYDCDATKEQCYAPTSYGNSYKAEGYSYGRHYAYPGPGARLKAAIKGFFHKIHVALCKKWTSFKDHWNKWCGELKSDAQRFSDWIKCKEQDWANWYNYYTDLCRTRKALWDDAMREFHRQWHHYKKCKKADYEDGKKKCKISHDDYDEKPEYVAQINLYGLSPVEKSYVKDDTYKAYSPEQYKTSAETYLKKYENTAY